MDCNSVHLNDIEFRQDASILLGLGSQQGAFRIKQITGYYAGGDASTAFPDDPLAVDTTTELVNIGPTQAVFNVPIVVSGVDVEKRLKQPRHVLNGDELC